MKQKNELIKRLLNLPTRSFFLFGPRGVGKSTWLHNILPEADYIDLLESSLYFELLHDPSKLEALINKKADNTWIIIDEIQKIPILLDEVHRLIEKYQWNFALCGSSARKLRRGGVNLLGGRALTRELGPFCFGELEDNYELESALNWGLLPYIYNDKKNSKDILNSYFNTYIKEEIKAEGIVRNLHPFIRFLNIAGQLNGQVINSQNISREAGVARSNIDVYFSILLDTLLGNFLPAYKPAVKVREYSHPKFYWFDTGVARASAGLLYEPVSRNWLGYGLETLIFHELRVYNNIKSLNKGLYYYASSGTEIDFIIETRKRTQTSIPSVVCIECKFSENWNSSWGRSMLSLASNDKILVEKMIGIYTGNKTYHFNGIDVFPVYEFLKRLYKGEIF